MSQENVEAFKRGIDAINRREIEELLAVLDPEVEWHDVFNVMLGGRATVYHGPEGVRKLFRDLYDAFAVAHSTYMEIQDLGDRILGIGHLRARGNESGEEIESPSARSRSSRAQRRPASRPTSISRKPSKLPDYESSRFRKAIDP